MSRHHLCVGGPLDGQTIAKPDHVKQFFVALPPEGQFTLGYPGAAAEVCTATIKTVTYTLTLHRKGALEWVAA